MTLSHPRARQAIFVVGIALLIFGFIGLLLNAPWGTVANSIFTFFGTTMSFAQFSIGFTGLKPADDGARTARRESQVIPPPAPANWQPKARLTGSFDQVLLGSAPFTIGRAPDNQKVLNDPQVSGYHALIRPEGQGFVIMDMGSSNGTWVNGQRLVPKVPRFLNPGDNVRIGNVTFTYEAKEPIKGFAQGAVAPTVVASPPGGDSTPSPLPVAAFAPTPIAPPPPGFAPGSFEALPVGSAYKTYRRSGIAFVLAGIGTILYILVLLALSALPTVPATFINAAVFTLIYVAAFAGLRGFSAKQASSAGWYGLAGALLLATGWLLNIVIGLFSCAWALSQVAHQSFPFEVLTLNGVLYIVNFLFLVLGDIVMGIGIVRARVYPRWTGITLAIIGLLDIIAVFSYAYPSSPLIALVQLIILGLASALFCRLGAALMK